MSAATQPLTSPPVLSWELFVGTIQLVIVGPGEKAWLPVSRPEFRRGHKPGTDNERRIAKRAVELLLQQHRENREMGPKEIKAVWDSAARQLGFDPAKPEDI